jgi:hypothetical protein
MDQQQAIIASTGLAECLIHGLSAFYSKPAPVRFQHFTREGVRA